MVYDFLKHIYTKCLSFSKKKSMNFILSWKQEQRVLDELGMPESDIDASFFQYKCQNICMGINSSVIFLFNILALLAIIPTILVFLFSNLFISKRRITKCVAAHPGLVSRYLIPFEVEQRCFPVAIMNRGYCRLGFKDLVFIFKLFFYHPISFYFNYKCLWMIAAYSYAIFRYEPKYILCSAEYSFTSSILTMYCEENNIAHYNIMHGVQMNNIICAYSRFSKFYIWDKSCIQTYQSVNSRTLISDYIVYKPRIEKLTRGNEENEAVYYLQYHSVDEMKRIKNYLDRMGKIYKVRPHPNYNTSAIYEIFGEGNIEDVRTIDIRKSFENTKLAISQCSAALYQAFMCDVPVVVDDLSNPMLFSEMQKRKHIVLNIPHRLLSDVL